MPFLARLVALKNDRIAVEKAARTISLAFSNDPLIRWLRPNAQSWGELRPSTEKWQYRRVQRAIYERFMFTLDKPPARSISDQSKSDSSDVLPTVTVPTVSRIKENCNDYGTVVLLENPKEYRRFSLWRLFGLFRLWLLDLVNPIDDGGDMQRVASMMESHNRELDNLSRRLHPHKPYYLEVIAVHPSLHGRGLGGQLMNAVIDHTHGHPIILECTDVANVGFYRKYGFEIVKEIRLETSEGDENILKRTRSGRIHRGSKSVTQSDAEAIVSDEAFVFFLMLRPAK